MTEKYKDGAHICLWILYIVHIYVNMCLHTSTCIYLRATATVVTRVERILILHSINNGRQQL